MPFYEGLISKCAHGDGSALYLGDAPLAELLREFRHRNVYCCWGFSPDRLSSIKLLDLSILSAEGMVNAVLDGEYSEGTGFLWMNEVGKVGGHDLIDIFSDHYNEYGALVIQEEPIDLMQICDDYPPDDEDAIFVLLYREGNRYNGTPNEQYLGTYRTRDLAQEHANKHRYAHDKDNLIWDGNEAMLGSFEDQMFVIVPDVVIDNPPEEE